MKDLEGIPLYLIIYTHAREGSLLKYSHKRGD